MGGMLQIRGGNPRPKAKSILEESFDGAFNPAFWEIRQSSTWENIVES